MMFSTTVSKPIGLQILSNSSYIDSFGFMHVVGGVKISEALKLLMSKL